VLNRILKDAFAATALLHTAIAVSDHGVDEGLAQSATIIGAACLEFSTDDAALAARPVPGLTGLPARPISYVRDLKRKIDKGLPLEAR
jgi:hypothetical protein